MRFSSILTLAAVTGFIALAPSSELAAQPNPPNKAITWPTGARPTLTYSTRRVSFDGSDIPLGTISGEGFAWEGTLPQVWVPAKDQFGYSLAFAPKDGQPLKFGIAVFDPKEFLPAIDDDTWDRYVAGLQQHHGDTLDLLDQTSATTPGSRWIPILGTKTRSITFRYSTEDGKFRSEIQVFAFFPNQLVAFVFSGPDKAVAANTELFYNAIRSLVEKTSARK